MSTKMIVRDKTDIAPVLLQIEKRCRRQDVPINTLLCETLLVHFLDSGLTEISVAVHARRIDLIAPGCEVDFVVPRYVDDETRLELEIGLGILESHKNRIDLRYAKGVNRCRIHAVSGRDADLSEEIEAFYENADERQRQKPTSVLVYLMKRHKRLFAVSMLFKTIRHLGAMLLPVFASGIIDVVLDSQPFFSRAVWLNILGSVLALAANLLGFWAETITYRRFTRSVESGFKLALVKKLQLLSFKYHNQAQSGHLLSKLISDIQFVGMLIYDRLQDVLHLIIDVLIVLCQALLRYPPMLVFYVAIIPAALLIIRSFSKPIMKRKTIMRRQTERTNASFKEMLEMDQLTRSHGLQQAEFRKISNEVRQVQQAAESFDTVNVAVNSVTYGGFQGFRLICLCFAAYLYTRGHISMGTVVLFEFLFDMLVNSIQRMLDALPQIAQGYDSLVSINEILFEKDVEHSGSLRLPEPVRGEIELDHLCFAYDDPSAPVLKDISLHLPAGKVAAFVGQSGAGKTSLLKLILGLYPPTGGEIRIDGMNLAELDLNDYRRHIAVVPQNTVLFSGTLWDNLVFGLKYVSRSQVMEVIRSVGLEDMLQSLPDGLNTVILEGGGNLSGGQRQRVAIARALLRDARIVLFDEATSALDAASEQQVQRAIDAMLSKCTVIMVAHRLNTLKKADLIYRIENGQATLYPSYESLIDESAGAMELR